MLKNFFSSIKKRDIIFTCFCCFLIIILIIIPTGYENPEQTNNVYYQKSEIIDVDNSNLQTISVVTFGNQKVSLKILSGKFKNQVFDAENVLNGQKEIDKIFKKGDKALAIIKVEDDKILSVRAGEFYRTGPTIVLCLIFVAILLLFGGFTGFRAIVSFIFTALVFWKIMLPMFLNNYNPLWVAILVCILTTSAVILLVSGCYKKGIVALLGSLSGIFITIIIVYISQSFFRIPATIQDYSTALIYTGINLDITSIFLTTIFVSSSGALMDISTDISASIDELVCHNKNLGVKQLIISGFKIGRPVIGSATTTLLFAYSGGYMFAFLAFMAKGMPLELILNSNFISAEIFHTLCGSLGLVLTAPLTAIIGGIIFGKK